MLSVNDIKSMARGITTTMIERLTQEQGWTSYDYVDSPDATPLAIATIELPDVTGGLVKVDVAGVQEDGSASLGEMLVVRYRKLGALTLGTVTSLFSETDITGASVTLSVDSDENLEVTATGTTDVIRWKARAQLLTTNIIATP